MLVIFFFFFFESENVLLIFFFFQAEDGIRDTSVTGVQTCALPIYFSQTGIERSQNAVLSGDDERLFVTRLVDLIGNSSPKGGSVQLTIDPAAQDAAWDGI